MLIALTRAVSPAISRCELTHLERTPIDAERAAAQHERYERLLAELGCRVERVPADPALADAVFIEDTAVVVEELAVIARPGAESRRQETAEVARRLGRYRPLAWIEPPGMLDGGDVVRAGRAVFVGQSSRTNLEGTTQLARALGPFGYVTRTVPVRGCLHLKSAATALSEELVLLNPAWTDPAAFPGMGILTVDPAEPAAANAARVGDTLLHGAGFPATRARIAARGLTVRPVDLSELAKAEGAVTCCCLLFSA